MMAQKITPKGYVVVDAEIRINEEMGSRTTPHYSQIIGHKSPQAHRTLLKFNRPHGPLLQLKGPHAPLLKFNAWLVVHRSLALKHMLLVLRTLALRHRQVVGRSKTQMHGHKTP